MVGSSAQTKAGMKADCWAQTKAWEKLEMVGSSAQTKDGMKVDCLALPTAVQMVGSLAQTKTKAGTKVSVHTPTLRYSLNQRIVYCRSRYTYRCSIDKDRMFRQPQYHYISVRLVLQPRRYVCTPMAVKKVGSSAQMKAQMKVDCWAQTKAIEINLEKKLAPLMVGMRWKVMNWAQKSHL